MKIIINGAMGTMGLVLANMIELQNDMEAVALVDPKAEMDVSYYKSLSLVDKKADVIIDFSHAESIDEVLKFSLKEKIPCVICTTGHNERQILSITEAAKEIPVFKSANMSMGVALLSKLVETAAGIFTDTDIEIVETHHNRKKDAPSGTAIMLANSAIKARPELKINSGRSGVCPREKNDIGISSIRYGNVVGVHEVILATNSQSITLRHDAYDRGLFAEGAIEAARFILDKPAGLYDMNDLIKDKEAGR